MPSDITFGPDGRAYISDWNNHRVRRVELDDSLRVIIGTDYEGDGPPEMEDRLPLCNPTGALGTTVAMNHPTSATFGPDGLLYVAAWHNNKIRIYDPATDIVTAFGDSYGFTGDGGPACAATFNTLKSIAIAPDGTMYAIDQKNVRIRKIDASRMISTIAGTGVVGSEGDGGQAIDAQLGFDKTSAPRPSGGLVLDGALLYLADSLNNRIRRIHLDTGIIDCIAGTGELGYSGDGGQALTATFNFPSDIEKGPDGRLYVADRGNHVIRAIDLLTGVVETVAGNGLKCDVDVESCSANALATEISLNEPYGIGFDAAGDLYVADTHNNRILRVVR
jgi:sugar lactone lactonase YvrE